MSDAYLERPYAQHAYDEARHEAFQETHAFRDALLEWAVQDDDVWQRFLGTNTYDMAFAAWLDGEA